MTGRPSTIEEAAARQLALWEQNPTGGSGAMRFASLREGYTFGRLPDEYGQGCGPINVQSGQPCLCCEEQGHSVWVQPLTSDDPDDMLLLCRICWADGT